MSLGMLSLQGPQGFPPLCFAVTGPLMHLSHRTVLHLWIWLKVPGGGVGNKNKNQGQDGMQFVNLLGTCPFSLHST